MTLVDTAAFFASMVVLAAVPSSSVVLVVSRAAAGGVRSGLATALGVVAGDLLLIGVAMFGLAALSEALGAGFVVVQMIGAAYLAFVGVSMLRSEGAPDEPSGAAAASSFVAGLALTLADAKALLFYLGFLPAFVDLAAWTDSDLVIVVLVTLLAVGGVKIAYALLATRVMRALGTKAQRWAKIAGGVVMLVVAALVGARAHGEPAHQDSAQCPIGPVAALSILIGTRRSRGAPCQDASGGSEHGRGFPFPGVRSDQCNEPERPHGSQNSCETHEIHKRDSERHVDVHMRH